MSSWSSGGGLGGVQPSGTPSRQHTDGHLGVVSLWCPNHLQEAEGLGKQDNYLPGLLGCESWKASELGRQNGFHFPFCSELFLPSKYYAEL